MSEFQTMTEKVAFDEATQKALEEMDANHDEIVALKKRK